MFMICPAAWHKHNHLKATAMGGCDSPAETPSGPGTGETDMCLLGFKSGRSNPTSAFVHPARPGKPPTRCSPASVSWSHLAPAWSQSPMLAWKASIVQRAVFPPYAAGFQNGWKAYAIRRSRKQGNNQRRRAFNKSVRSSTTPLLNPNIASFSGLIPFQKFYSATKD